MTRSAPALVVVLAVSASVAAREVASDLALGTVVLTSGKTAKVVAID